MKNLIIKLHSDVDICRWQNNFQQTSTDASISFPPDMEFIDSRMHPAKQDSKKKPLFFDKLGMFQLPVNKYFIFYDLIVKVFSRLTLLGIYKSK